MVKTTVRKKKTVRAARRVTGLKAIPTNSWRNAKYYTHYEVESREWGKVVKEYIKKTLDKNKVAAINKLPDWKLGAYSHWACVAQLKETAPEIIPEEYNIAFGQFLEKLVEQGEAVAEQKKEETKPKKCYTPTIQERISEQAQDACDKIEEWLEGYITDPKSFDPKGFDFVSHFSTQKVTQAHARKIKKYYEGWLEEARAVANMPTPAQIKKIKDEHEADIAQQIREGYSHVKKADATKWLNALENLMGACDMIIDAAKATRKPKAKKAPSKEKLIAKLKYKETDDKYQLASVNPIELVDCTEVWVFNTKTRKLGKYVVDSHATNMSVKGTSLVGFSETASVQKTVRKPEEVLKEFKKAGKVKLRKFLDEINAVETKLNGRLNSDTVILRVS